MVRASVAPSGMIIACHDITLIFWGHKTIGNGLDQIDRENDDAGKYERADDQYVAMSVLTVPRIKIGQAPEPPVECTEECRLSMRLLQQDGA